MKTTDRPVRAVELELPYNARAEEIVLGTLLGNPYKIEVVVEVLKPTDFYIVRHKILYEIMLNYYHRHGEGADFVVLANLLEKSEDLEASDLVRLMGLADELWSVDLMQDTSMILGTSVQRQILFASQQLATIGFTISEPDKSRNAVESLLYNLTMEHAPQSDFEHLGDIIGRCMTNAEKAYDQRGTIQGIPSGFHDLDKMTNGFQRGDLILLAGRPSMGKTALGMGMGYNAAKKNFNVAVFSLEMGKEQLGTRLLSLQSRIPSNLIRGGWLTHEDFDKLVEASDTLNDLPIHIDDTSGSPISSMRSKLRRLKAKTKHAPDLVIVDYLGLMQPENDTPAKQANRVQEVGEISRGLKGIAKEFNVPVLALAQLSRAVESRQSKVPQLSDLRDSGNLEQDADVVMFVYRDDYYAGYDQDGKSKSNREGTADIIVAKHRNGPVGEVALKFTGNLTRFDNLNEETEE
jgi:replicative DNA helicase